MTLNTRTATVAVATFGLALTGLGVATAGQAVGTSADTGVGSTQLVEMREEERMARDLYSQLADSSGARIFDRIAAAEQRHMDAVERLMESRGMSTTFAGEKVGTYSVPELQQLYTGWLSEGKVSADAAYDVGVELEKADLADLRALDVEDGTDVALVVEHLIAGSEHHLAAFTKAANGETTGVGPMGNGAMGNGQRQQEQRQGSGDGTCPFGQDGSGTQSRPDGQGRMGGMGYRAGGGPQTG